MGKIIILVLLCGCVYGQQITGGGTGTGSATAAGATGDVQCKASNGNLAACGINDNGVTVAIPSRTLSVSNWILVGAGTTLPATCTVGSSFLHTAATLGLYHCTATNSWALPSGAPSTGTAAAVQSSDGAGGLSDSGCTATGGAMTCASGFSSSGPYAVSGAEQAKPAAPASGSGKVWFDSTAHIPQYEGSAGTVVGTMLAPLSGATTHQWVSYVDAAGVQHTAAPASTDLSDAASYTAPKATALATTPSKCSAGNYPLGVDTGGNAQNCTAASTSGGLPAFDATIVHQTICEPNNSTSDMGCVGDANNVQGSPTLGAVTSTDQALFTNYATGATSGTYAGFYSNNSAYYTGRVQTMTANARVLQTATQRSVVGFAGGLAACVGGDVAVTNCATIVFSTAAADTNFMCVAATSGGITRTSIGVAANTSYHFFKVVLTGGTSVACTVDSTTITVATNVPPNTASLNVAVALETLANVSSSINVRNIYAQN